MKQSEKLDLILRGLYQHRDEGIWGIDEILQSYGLSISNEEIWRLAHRLKDDGYIDGPYIGDGKPTCRINTYGIEYCEESSYTYKGESLITNNYFSITDSPNAAIVNNSQNVLININNYREVKEKIAELKGAINSNGEIDMPRKQDILGCLEEMESSVEAGQIPKYSFRSLLSMSSDIATILPIVYALAKLLGVPLP